MCDIDTGDFDAWQVWSEKIRRARKPYACDCCGASIPAGQHYVAHFSVTRYGTCSERWCLHCFDAMKEFGDEHGSYFAPSMLGQYLAECVDADESPRWTQLLNQMHARGLAAEGVSP